MAYVAITCLMSTIQQSMQLTGCNLQSFYQKLEYFIAIMEKPSNITGDLEALASFEARIAEVAYGAEDKVDSKSMKVVRAKTDTLRGRAFGKLCCFLEQVVEHIDSIMKQWMAIGDGCNNIEEEYVFLEKNRTKRGLAFWKRAVVGRLDSTMNKWMMKQSRCTKSKDVEAQNLTVASTSRHSLEDENMMVGYENEFVMMQDQLTRGASDLEVVSVVGMGGIGKTTLANKLYSDPFISSCFDIRAKATVSQDYCARNVLLCLLSSICRMTDQPYEEQNDGQLADQLQKLLKGPRYLVVIDDIWTTKAWDDIKLCFPDCNSRSRILMTTRNMEVAEYASSGKPPYQMRLLNFDESWSLLYEKVFAREFYPPEFEQFGKQIALKCGGLPLAIIVIAGLLSKIGKVLDEWKRVSENVSSAVSTNLDVQCMRVLALSYHHLPHHLRACFLYFALFPEDELIFVNKLVKIWAAEGFLKVDEMKSMEQVAKKCLKDLVDRSLIFIHRVSSFDGKLKYCGMHDVIRELCLREARNMNFVNVIKRKNYLSPCAQSMHFSSTDRGRISIQLHRYRTEEKKLSRCPNNEARSIFLHKRKRGFMSELLSFKLVRVLDLALMRCSAFPSSILDLIHLRYLALSLSPGLQHHLGEDILDIPPLISSLCYLQVFILKLSHHEARRYPFILPLQILTMPQLRRLRLDWNYLRYHEPTEKSLVLKNLQFLSGWNPLYCTVSVFRLFPNLRKLQIRGIREDFRSFKDLYDFRFLDQLEELEFCLSYPDFACFLESFTPSGATPQDIMRFTRRKRPEMKFLERPSPLLPPPPGALPFIPIRPARPLPPLFLPPPDAFPQNLKNLAFSGTSLRWKDLIIVGKLPKLESLKLAHDACIGYEWEVFEEGFPCLKFLQLKDLGIRYWRAGCEHFPCLERLFLERCRHLDSIPQDFTDITTLALIDITYCSESVENSAKQIQQDIQDNYASSVEIHIRQSIKR
ncbi:hypothetical protein HAX54_024387 [Datura stramonium]|uniref:Uncharacterized protein n=1 Tax=Datura stramonium TaxID=4076 RepID=A0ABS8UZK8_DATST|nr:hypothetical protein [Datura stramonium]